MAVKPIPDGYHTVTPYLIINGAARAIEFYKNAFNASELYRIETPDGKIGHAEIQVGDSRIMLGDESPEVSARSPAITGGSSVALNLYVEDVDAFFRQAIAAGAKEERPVKDQLFGDRSGAVLDPFGHRWAIATHKEDVSVDEIKRRAAAAMRQGD